ncbi:MAG: lytic murein transglycosylase [Bdellovibrionales bacterium]|nr:lytic murein transglycosylase [Bdellovibrionales bacterium]
MARYSGPIIGTLLGLSWGLTGMGPSRGPTGPEPTLSPAIDTVSALPLNSPGLEKRMKRAGLKTEFIADLLSEDPARPKKTFQEKAVYFMLTQFAMKPSYSYATEAVALDSTRAFLEKNQVDLAACEAKYGVPAETLTSLMWVETKLGTRVGNYPIVDVYLSLVRAADPDAIALIQEKFDRAHEQEKEWQGKGRKKAHRLIEARAKKFVRFATEELRALSKLEIPIHELKGSWAGAFGLGQFIPSTFKRLAKDGNGDGRIDPYSVADCACSIGSFLKRAGWGKKPKQQKRALYGYNQSKPYGEAILNLSKQLGDAGGRAVAGTEAK